MAFGDNTSSAPDTLASLRRKSRPARPSQPDLFSIPEPQAPERRSAPVAVTSGVPIAPADRQIYSVRALVADIRQHTECAYANVWVEGEISNCRPSPSGHIYFTLKDGEAQLPIVLFRREATLLRFRPQDGLAVLVKGRVSVYESRGQLQLIAETMEPRGAGALQLAFEQLKRRLAEEGLFDADRKRPLPAFPHRVGIITSASGAVVQDFMTVIRRRHARLDLLIYPASMQGQDCSSSVAAGIRWFNAAENNLEGNPARVDLIVLARGGGSMEDLSGFNDESLARAIANSTLPVVSAIGHETDFTIADFAADLRAPTPSAAAEIITASQHRVEEHVEALSSRLARASHYRMIMARQRYARLSADAVLGRLRDSLHRREQRLDDLSYRLESVTTRQLRASSVRQANLLRRLDRLAPTAQLALAHRRLDQTHEALARISLRLIERRRMRVASATHRLEALSPLAVLNRGYALVYAENGSLLRSATETSPGQTIRARVASGIVEAEVTGAIESL